MPPSCTEGEPRLERVVDASAGVQEVCIRPRLSTTFLFDGRVARMELEGQEHFQVMKGEEGFTLRLKDALSAGTRLALTVHLLEEGAERSVSLVLRVDDSQGERQVKVVSPPRTLDSYREGEQQARAALHQCERQKERLQAECGGPGGLLGLIVNGAMDKKGVDGKGLVPTFQGDALLLTEGVSYRSLKRVAVALKFLNPGTVPRQVKRVALVGPRGEEVKVLGQWWDEAIGPGDLGLVAVELEAVQVPPGEYTLQLWGEGGEGGAAWRMEVRGVQFH
jgi:uncharacterized protein (TIGR02268 family)